MLMYYQGVNIGLLDRSSLQNKHYILKYYDLHKLNESRRRDFVAIFMPCFTIADHTFVFPTFYEVQISFQGNRIMTAVPVMRFHFVFWFNSETYTC
jgi:hypothetical protein